MRCAILGSGNIGTDLMMKLLKGTDASGIGTTPLELVALVGIDPASDGLARAKALGIDGPHEGPQWILDHADDIDLVFDATSAYVHVRHYKQYADAGIVAVDLTPAARGPKVIAAVNLTEHLDAPNINMVTCGGQATTPMVYAIRRAVEALPYAEMVSTVSSQVGGAGHAAEHRRVHQDHVDGAAGDRRGGAEQGDHHPEPGRAPDHDAQHRLRRAAGGHRP